MRNRKEKIEYFHATIKERRAANGINKLLERDGKWLKIKGEIHYEITQFDQNLQGTTIKNLMVVDRDIIRKGRDIDASSTQMLINEVSEVEIK